ncbi:hypothetical protein DXX93_05980 [Thalassotalea euphylliae]|uniref:Uncharacterized protein n=2 Tax=Thalassotalea euphylliae TaxID=1655234 RepID=A0A3E0TNS3_9GAMM|nr:hypothetical protein DXX93_05980 [Thalassotalea euphylliae]
MIIQAVDREINRLTALPDDSITPTEEIRLVDYESLADELEDAYEKASAGHTNLPEYNLLVTDRGQDDG